MKAGLLYILLVCCCGMQLQAQKKPGDDREKAEKLVAAAQKKYAAGSWLQFEVQYLYTNESTPRKILDSTGGRLILNGSNYWYNIQNTITVKTDHYSIMVFPDDKLISIAKSAAQPSPLGAISQMDSMWQKIRGLQVTVTETNAGAVVDMHMPPGQSYKSITLLFDKQSGLLANLVYVLGTDNLVDPTERKAKGREAYEPYARVETRFIPRNDSLDKTVLDESRYFTRNGNDIQPSAAYADYKIFRASLNL